MSIKIVYQEVSSIQNVPLSETDIIEYEPEAENEAIYEYIEVEQQQQQQQQQIDGREIENSKDSIKLFRIKNLPVRTKIVSDGLFACANHLCKKNSVAFNTKEEMEAHNEIHLNQFNNSQCPICNKNLSTLAKLQKHLDLRHTLRNYICDQCGKIFRSKDNLRLHMSHHRKYFYVECRACRKGYKSVQSLRYHLRQHFEHHECEDCGKIFEHKKLLIGHVAAMHKSEMQVQCRFCSRMFSRTDVRDTHEREIHKNGAIGSYFKCNECDASFDLRDELTSHKILNHFSGIIHTCEVIKKFSIILISLLIDSIAF
jgi:hypothetical protein